MSNIVIKTKKLCKSYDSVGKTQIILNNISLDIYESDFTVIMGSSGSGKSTLLYSMSLMDHPSSGEIEILGLNSQSINDREITQLRQSKISFVFQNFNLLPDLTAFENIAYPAYLTMSKRDANKRASELLESLGLSQEKDKHPSNMSGGQQQRVAISRALSKNPEIIFADEPTGSLNSTAGKQVLDLLSGLNEKGQTIIMVTHDIKACARGYRILYISDGQIVGNLNLSKYKPEKQKEREEEVFNILAKHNW